MANRALAPLGDADDFYATLEKQLDKADLGPAERPSLISPATRLVEGCRRLDG